MKKTNTKLQLKTHTIRMLQTSELGQANGGRLTFGCTGQQTTCFAAEAQPTNGGGNANHGGDGH